MFNVFKGALLALVREKSVFIWSLAFPLILSTMFVFMFANLEDVYKRQRRSRVYSQGKPRRDHHVAFDKLFRKKSGAALTVRAGFSGAHDRDVRGFHQPDIATIVQNRRRPCRVLQFIRPGRGIVDCYRKRAELCFYVLLDFREIVWRNHAESLVENFGRKLLSSDRLFHDSFQRRAFS